MPQTAGEVLALVQAFITSMGMWVYIGAGIIVVLAIEVTWAIVSRIGRH